MDELLGAATAAIAALTELTGQPPETAEQDGLLTLQADPSRVPAEHWHRLVAVLETGTSYGMTTTAAGASVVWLRIELGETTRP
ncbi:MULTISPECIES: hypothetical protein [unclassified Streptomyces]|uniref:hypothetical protein n=1 Tax=unclassified Streptomyces TaxID=2593676 RepID=UPI001BEA3B07|nr:MULTISPECIES: hypothetical protein [unclassified Streptomyces]MBT2404590.1 hypothetical protein [Streptomyces sp. ISL-21]MBT2610472.1 hypothetical protein [Streptomyces sp. ISL-87]